jgi:aspartate aminotransferase
MDPMAAVASETYTSVSAPIQYAAVTAFNGGIVIERYLWHARRILSYLGARCTELLEAAGIRVHHPDGAFYLFADFGGHIERLRSRGITNSMILCERLLEETGVAILPGASFLRPADELTARIAFVNFNGAKAMAMSETVPLDEKMPQGMYTAACGSVFEAIQRIADWVAD